MNQQPVALREPAQLFHHLSKHHVVICTICRHAVAPKAVDRHLKEVHGVHHSLRPSFVAFTEKLDLCEPGDAAPPSGDDFPVPELPVFHGLLCGFEGCGHLCLTEKRMKSHWAAAQHPCEKPANGWYSVPVQTFFRGNQLNYFCGSYQPTGFGSILEGTKRCDDTRGMGQPIRKNTQLPNPCPSDRHIKIENTAEGLLRHYQTSTGATITADGDDQVLWQQAVPRLARDHEFLLLGLLAFTSLHLSHFHPSHRYDLTIQANSYQDKAMSAFREALAAPTPDNCNAIVVFHHLLVLYTFAAQQPEDDLLIASGVDDEAAPRWLHFIRSACDLVCKMWDSVEGGPCWTLIYAWEAPFKTSKSHEVTVLESLLAVIPPMNSDRAWATDVVGVYKQAASELARAFACSKSSPDRFSIWDVLRVWPVEVSTEFMTLLQKEHPGALVLLAHFTALLRRIDDLWYFGGRADSLLRTVYRKLDPYWYAWIPPRLNLL